MEPPAAAARERADRTGGAYVPPFKLAQLLQEATDKTSAAYQRASWDALRKSINGLVNKARTRRAATRPLAVRARARRRSPLPRALAAAAAAAIPARRRRRLSSPLRSQVNVSNLPHILPELFRENLVRGRGLLVRSVMKSQMASPQFSAVLAALVAVVNTKLPDVGALTVQRVVVQFRRAYKRNDKPVCLAVVRFLAALVQQRVVHELIALELLTLLLGTPTEDSVELAVEFVREAGATLGELAPGGLHAVFERLRGILHEGALDKRVQFTIEGLFALRKGGFQGHAGIPPGLDLVEEADAIVHEVSLDDPVDAQAALDVFSLDADFAANEAAYAQLRASILGEDSEGGEGGSEGEGEEEEEEEAGGEGEAAAGGAAPTVEITDATEANLVNLRRVIYLTIMSSLDFEEAGHKLLKISLAPGQEGELCTMILECCSQERTFLKYYGLLAARFCFINPAYVARFDDMFAQQYATVHRLETNKLRNVARFFAHLLAADALPWSVLAYIQLTEEATTSSSRIFVKILFQELAETLGLKALRARLDDAAMGAYYAGLLPRDSAKNARFAINFWTSIGLGGLTDGLRGWLKELPARLAAQQAAAVAAAPPSSSSSYSSSSSSYSSSYSDSYSSSSESESSDSRPPRKKGKR